MECSHSKLSDKGSKREKEEREEKEGENTFGSVSTDFKRKDSDKHLPWDTCKHSVYTNRDEEFIIKKRVFF